jgi:hypothetical protein
LARPDPEQIGFNAGLLALSLYHGDWLRPAEAWHPVKQNPWPQFNALAQHLLARFQVPAFMTSAWFGIVSTGKMLSTARIDVIHFGIMVYQNAINGVATPPRF